jgi:endonuclease/exonuclease/phosphatase family metal-dependent hydrolase
MSRAALRIVTWNVWFGDLERALRRRALFEALDAAAPDIVCLQEVTPAFMRGPELAELPGRGWSVGELSNNYYDTLILTRPRVVANERLALPSEMGRNLSLVRLATDPPLTVATVHLESTREMTPARVRQLELITARLADETCVVLVGDLNFPDGARPEAAVLAGWRDAWPTCRPDEPGYTVDAEVNEMRALLKPNKKRARLDRAYLHGAGWRFAGAELLGTKCLPGDPLTFVSDHFGLQVDLVAEH